MVRHSPMFNRRTFKNLPWDKVRQMEQFFFRQEPWCKLDGSRLGTPKLVSALSTLLSTMIQERYLKGFVLKLIKSLPEVQKRIAGHRKRVGDELTTLPESFI